MRRKDKSPLKPEKAAGFRQPFQEKEKKDEFGFIYVAIKQTQ